MIVIDLRVTGTFAAAKVLATRTFLSLAYEESATHMACPAYPLLGCPPLHIFPSDTRTHCQGDHFRTGVDSNHPPIRSLFLPVLFPVA